jgi:hypothetical protein
MPAPVPTPATAAAEAAAEQGEFALGGTAAFTPGRAVHASSDVGCSRKQPEQVGARSGTARSTGDA